MQQKADDENTPENTFHKKLKFRRKPKNKTMKKKKNCLIFSRKYTKTRPSRCLFSSGLFRGSVTTLRKRRTRIALPNPYIKCQFRFTEKETEAQRR